jgi:hypothetical protein
MTRYLIPFDDGAMTFPEEEGPAVAKAAHAVVQAAQEAGGWIFGGGVESQRASIVATDGTVTDGPYPETKAVIGGFAMVDVPSRRRRWSGLPSSPSPAAARRKSGRSCSTRSSDRKRPAPA